MNRRGAPLIAFHGIHKNGRAQVLVVREGGARPGELALPTLRDDEPRHFAWGYRGVGPTELARAILTAAFPDDQVVRSSACYERFEREVIAELPYEFHLELEAIRDWRRRWEQTVAGGSAAAAS